MGYGQRFLKAMNDADASKLTDLEDPFFCLDLIANKTLPVPGHHNGINGFKARLFGSDESRGSVISEAKRSTMLTLQRSFSRDEKCSSPKFMSGFSQVFGGNG